MSSKNVVNIGLKAVKHFQHSKSSKIPFADLKKSSSAYLSSVPSGGKHILPDLPYDYDALEPCISAETMTLHHKKHHNTYVTNLNVGLEKLDSFVSSGNVSGIIGLQDALRFNGGGHLNHTLFWENLCPKGSTELKSDGLFAKEIEKSFGSVENMKSQLSTASVGVQGSGWGWLGYNGKNGKLEICTRSNQDPLEATTGLTPIIGIDVWEHAYYVDYRNVRPDYVKAIWDVLNWDVAEKRLIDAKK